MPEQIILTGLEVLDELLTNAASVSALLKSGQPITLDDIAAAAKGRNAALAKLDADIAAAAPAQ